MAKIKGLVVTSRQVTLPPANLKALEQKLRSRLVIYNKSSTKGNPEVSKPVSVSKTIRPAGFLTFSTRA